MNSFIKRLEFDTQGLNNIRHPEIAINIKMMAT